MLHKINPQIVRQAWFGFIPLASFIFMFLIAIAFGRYKRRQLLTAILWFGAAAAIWTTYLMCLIADFSTNSTL